VHCSPRNHFEQQNKGLPVVPAGSPCCILVQLSEFCPTSRKKWETTPLRNQAGRKSPARYFYESAKVSLPHGPTRAPFLRLLCPAHRDKDPAGVDLTNAELKAFQDNWSKGSLCPERTFSSFSWIAAFTKVVRIPTFSPFTQRLLFGSWSPACRLPSEAKRPSHSPDEIDEYAFVVVLQIGQVVGEVGEVVADASLQVLANMTIDRGQRAAAPLTYIR
jgi:hypothetical protein